jgi:predicted transcriptional regulator
MEQKSLDSKLLEKYEKDIINFGLSKEEALVFLSLLKRGPRGEIVGRIKDELSIGRTTIYAIMERLAEKGWVISEEISENPKRVKYVAKSPYMVFNETIERKEKELQLLKEYGLFIGDKLEQIYQGAKKLNIDTIHLGGYVYLKDLVSKGWKIKSEVIEHSESLGRLTLDYELKGIKGFPKDCGLIIFDYNRYVEDDNGIITDALSIFKRKTDYEIRQDKIPGFEDIKLEETSFQDYPGANVYIKLKFKKRWWLVGREAVIPIKKKIFLIFGNKENFEILFETILNSEKFHHLV